MSRINDDKKVVHDGRRNKLEDAEVALRDQIVKKLRAKLIEDGIGEKVVEMWLHGNANRTNWLERQKEYLASWDEHLEGDTSGAFDQSSNLHLPMPFIISKTMHARFLQALLGIDPPFHVKARTEASIDTLPVVSDTLRYAISEWANQYQGMEEALDKWIWAWVTQGSGILKLGWDTNYTRYVDVEEVEEEDVPDFVVNPDGTETVVPKKKLVEKERTVTKKTFDGPICRFREVEDILIIGGEGDPDRADAVIDSDFLDASQLWTFVDRGVYDEDSVTKVIESGPDLLSADQQGQLKQDRSLNAGKSSMDHDYDHDRYRILEAHLRYDVDGSGIFSDVIVWVHERTREVLRATYLRRVNRSGERPFKKIDFHIRNGQEYGIGIVELIYPLCKELDAMHNMRIDFGMLSTMPFGFYRASSSINPETIQLEPGALIPVDDPSRDVFFPNLGNRTVFGFQEESSLQEMLNRLTSISDLNLGVMGGQGATRTATGTRALVGEASANLDVYLRRLNRGWRRALEYLMHMLQQRIPPGLSFRVTGDGGAVYWRTVRDEAQLEGDFDIEVSPNSSSSNKQVQQELAQQVLQLTSNPLDIQLQIITPAQRYEALKNFLQSLGIKEYNRYISKPNGYIRPRLTPEEEANRILRGQEVKVLPDDDHEGFVSFFQYLYDHDELLGQFTEAQTIMLAQQAQKHAQMQKAVAFMQAQAANAAQMRANAAQSQDQAPVGANPMSTGAQAPVGTSPSGE